MGLLSIVRTSLLCCCLAAAAKVSGEDFRYKRSSLYTALAIDPAERFSGDFGKLFEELPLPDKYDDHGIGLRVFRIAQLSQQERQQALQGFLHRNQVAKRMVAKWFGRDRATGCFDTRLVAERGHYNASQLDTELARTSALGYALLGDAGEQLLGNTFVALFHFDYRQQLKSAEKVLEAAFGTIEVVSDQLTEVTEQAREKGYFNGALQNFFENMEKLTPDFAASFQMEVTCYLYRLRWDEPTSATFYQNYWIDADTPPQTAEARRRLFENERELFRLDYVGATTLASERVSTQGCRDNRTILSKLFARVMDRSLVELQRRYEIFRVKAPLYGADRHFVTARVGRKEGLGAGSQYEVLEAEEDPAGRVRYVRKGLIEPLPDKIWDNRFMAAEEQADGANYGHSVFRIVEGKDFYPGMLIRETGFTPR